MRKKFNFNKKVTKKLNVNQQIRAKEVRVIDDKGEMLGLKSFVEAMQIANEKDLDLIEVSPVPRFVDLSRIIEMLKV